MHPFELDYIMVQWLFEERESYGLGFYAVCAFCLDGDATFGDCSEVCGTIRTLGMSLLILSCLAGTGQAALQASSLL